MQLRQELRLLVRCSEILSDDLRVKFASSPNFPASKSRSAETIADLLGCGVAYFLRSWVESLAVAQFTRRGGHPLQPD
jgi:hypothetical protein